MELTESQILLRLENAIEKIYHSKDEVEIPCLKEVERSIKRRIHNEGKDTNGDQIGIKGKRGGKYSPAYEKFKMKIVGDSIYPINLQLYGDLIKGYGVAVKNGSNVICFLDELSELKMTKMEKLYKTDIIRPSNEDLDNLKEIYLTRLKNVLINAFS